MSSCNGSFRYTNDLAEKNQTVVYNLQMVGWKKINEYLNKWRNICNHDQEDSILLRCQFSSGKKICIFKAKW